MTPELLDRSRVEALPARLLGDARARWVAGAAAFAVLGLTSSEDDAGIVFCPFRRCTGGYCPGCGMTRSGGALLRGDVAASWRQHPFLVLAITQLAIVGVLLTAGGDRAAQHVQRWQRDLLLANVAVVVAIWAVRLATGSIPLPFS
jgi:hypothetical protein